MESIRKLKYAILIFIIVASLTAIACCASDDKQCQVDEEFKQFKRENPPQDKPCKYIDSKGKCFK